MAQQAARVTTIFLAYNMANQNFKNMVSHVTHVPIHLQQVSAHEFIGQIRVQWPTSPSLRHEASKLIFSVLSAIYLSISIVFCGQMMRDRHIVWQSLKLDPGGAESADCER